MDTLLVKLALLIAAIGSLFAVNANTCLQDGHVSDLNTCLQQINADMQNTSLFGFGTTDRQKCSVGFYGADCQNALGTISESMAARIFGNNQFTGDTLNRFLDVSYTSLAGEYYECDTTISLPSSSFKVDPVDKSADQRRASWFYRTAPAVSWHNQNKGVVDTDSQFTLLVVDVGYGFMHGIYININGSELGQQATTVKAYQGPWYSGSLVNPYAFILYRQGNLNMQLNPQWTAAIANPLGGFNIKNITDFANDQNLAGPIGMNWIQVTGDLYAQNKLNFYTSFTGTFIQNCVPHIQKALQNHSRSFLPQSMDLSVWMAVSMTSSPIKVEACCHTENYGQKSFPIDPLGNTIYNTAETRTGVTLDINMQMNKFMPRPTDFIGKMHTLIVLDPDVPKVNVNPILHGLMINIPSGVYENGTAMKTYSGPTPPDFVPHYYYLLLYEQKEGTLQLNDTLGYSTTDGHLAGRGKFDINRFVGDFKLTLVGVSWYRAETDLYVLQRNIKSEEDKENMCSKLYTKDFCSTSAAPMMGITLLLPAMFIVALSSVTGVLLK